MKTHDLEVLLKFSGIEPRVKAARMDDWAEVVEWDPDTRYQTTGHATQHQAARMIECTKRLLRVL